MMQGAWLRQYIGAGLSSFILLNLSLFLYLNSLSYLRLPLSLISISLVISIFLAISSSLHIALIENYPKRGSTANDSLCFADLWDIACSLCFTWRKWKYIE
jgi:hypothetical protein